MVFDYSLHVYMTAKKFTKEHTYICYIHAHIHKYITYIYTSTHTYVHTYTHAYIHAYIHVYIHIYIHTYITYIPTYIHAYIHTHTYIHVHDSCWHTWLCLTLNRSAAKGSSNAADCPVVECLFLFLHKYAVYALFSLEITCLRSYLER